MATVFSRSIRSLSLDGFRRSNLAVAAVMALLVLWALWLLAARVALYEISETARLEVDQAVYPVQAPVAGRIVATHLIINQEVQSGEMLIELDSEFERLQQEEEQTRVIAFSRQLEALRSEVTAREQAYRQEKQAAAAASDEAQARKREAQAAAQFAKEEAERLGKLHERGHISELDLLRAKAEAQKRQAAAEALLLTVSRMEKEQLTKESDQRAELERLRRELALLEGQIETAKATIARLGEQIAKRHIRAPISGVLGEVAYLRIGAVVSEGDTLATVVPAGKLRVVANFLPSAALGRIRTGQAARLRLDGFPWTQYGSISATVASIAGEVRDGRVRVELTVHPDSTSLVPLQHGLPGVTEVEVERVSPATLMLRTAGKIFASPRASPAAPKNQPGKR